MLFLLLNVIVDVYNCRSIVFGVYGPSRAQTQEDYDAAIKNVFGGLDKVRQLINFTNQRDCI